MILVPNIRVKDEYVCGEVDGREVVCGITRPCQKWYMHHITLIKRLHSIFIPVSSYLDHYTVDGVHGELSSFRKTG